MTWVEQGRPRCWRVGEGEKSWPRRHKHWRWAREGVRVPVRYVSSVLIVSSAPPVSSMGAAAAVVAAVGVLRSEALSWRLLRAWLKMWK